MYKTKSSSSNINMKSQIDTIATMTTSDFISPPNDPGWTSLARERVSPSQGTFDPKLHRLLVWMEVPKGANVHNNVLPVMEVTMMGQAVSLVSKGVCAWTEKTLILWTVSGEILGL